MNIKILTKEQLETVLFLPLVLTNIVYEYIEKPFICALNINDNNISISYITTKMDLLLIGVEY